MVALGLFTTRHLHADMATAVAAALVSPGTLLEAAQIQASPTTPKHGAHSTSACRAEHPAMDHLAETPLVSWCNTGSPVPHLQECPCRHGHRRCGCTSVPRDTVSQPRTPPSTAQHWAGAQPQCHALWAGEDGHLVTKLRLCVPITCTERGGGMERRMGIDHICGGCETPTGTTALADSAQGSLVRGPHWG